MVSPSKKKRVETFMNLYKNDPLIGKNLGTYIKTDHGKFTPLPKFYYQWKFKNLKEDQLYKLGYKEFVRAVGGNDYIRDTYFKELKKQGYSFVTDDMDAGKFGKDPVIVFDRAKDLVFDNSRVVSPSEAAYVLANEGIYLMKK